MRGFTPQEILKLLGKVTECYESDKALRERCDRITGMVGDRQPMPSYVEIVGADEAEEITRKLRSGKWYLDRKSWTLKRKGVPPAVGGSDVL